jgi:hypothetical protein
LRPVTAIQLRKPGSALGLAVVVAVFVVSGCGGGGSQAVPFKKAGPPPPEKCLERHNNDPTALELAKHAYSPGHNSRSARVFAVNKPEQGLADACVVIYADAESDREYTTLGQFTEGPEWTIITYYPLPTQKERIALQKSGAEQSNAQLTEDGKLRPFQ